LVLGCSQASLAADNFTISATVGAQNAAVGFRTADEVFDFFGTQRLSNFVPYNGFEIVNANVGIRGLPVTIAYPVLSGSQLDLNIPSLGIQRTFNGATRDESFRLLKEFFKTGPELDRIMRELAKTSPVDPVAGNPNSLQSRMVAGTYDRSFRSLVSKLQAADERRRQAASVEETRWKIAAVGATVPLGEGRASTPAKTPSTTVGLTVGTYKQAGLRGTSVTVPLSYAFPPDPARPFSLDGELQYTDTEGAKTYNVAVGGAYRIEISERGFVIPSANYGITGSEDLGSVGQIVSASITSGFRIYQSPHFSLWMGNGISYLRTLKTSIQDYSFDPNLSNMAFVNGLVLSTPMPTLGANIWIEYSFSDTRYTGSDLFNRRYDEIGVAIGRSSGSRMNPSYWKIGASYLNGTHSKGGAVNLHYSF
jgi:hypothetical protein